MEVAETERPAVKTLADLNTFPNPVRRQAVISYCLARTSKVDCQIFDINGRMVRRVAAGQATAGEQQVVWNRDDAGGIPVPAGVYFVQVRSDGENARVKIVVVD